MHWRLTKRVSSALRSTFWTKVKVCSDSLSAARVGVSLLASLQRALAVAAADTAAEVDQTSPARWRCRLRSTPSRAGSRAASAAPGAGPPRPQWQARASGTGAGTTGRSRTVRSYVAPSPAHRCDADDAGNQAQESTDPEGQAHPDDTNVAHAVDLRLELGDILLQSGHGARLLLELCAGRGRPWRPSRRLRQPSERCSCGSRRRRRSPPGSCGWRQGLRPGRRSRP